MSVDPKQLDPPDTDQPQNDEPQVFAVSQQGDQTNFTRRDFLVLAGTATAGLALIAESATPVVAQGSKPTATPVTICMVSTKQSLLNLRSGPGKTYDVVAQMEKNKNYPVLAKGRDKQKRQWWQIAVDGVGQAWVAASYVKTVGPCSKVPSLDAPPPIVATPGSAQPGTNGINFTASGKEYTLPCGSAIPAGAVCTCNCVSVPPLCSCDGYSPCSCQGYSSGGHYWYPN